MCDPTPINTHRTRDDFTSDLHEYPGSVEAVPASDPVRGVKPLGPSDPPTIGSYQRRGVLGSGGMGRVYLGQSRTGRRVAIKVIRPDLAEDAVFRDRFTREVAAARLVSPLFTAA